MQAEALQHRPRPIILADCMEKLQPGHRQLLQQFYEGERSVKDLAEAYKKTAMALYQRIHRLRIVLMECVQKESEQRITHEF